MPEKKRKILLVDDSRTTLMMERMVLQQQPYELITAADGQEGVARALEERPDLILLDVVMPKMNGFEVCKMLRETEATRDTPIIMVTTRGESNHVEHGFKLGCNDYVSKPINSLELLTKVRGCLGEID